MRPEPYFAFDFRSAGACSGTVHATGVQRESFLGMARRGQVEFEWPDTVRRQGARRENQVKEGVVSLSRAIFAGCKEKAQPDETVDQSG